MGTSILEFLIEQLIFCVSLRVIAGSHSGFDSLNWCTWQVMSLQTSTVEARSLKRQCKEVMGQNRIKDIYYCYDGNGRSR